MSRFPIWLATALLLCVGDIAFGAAPTPISKLPFTISKPGRYAFTRSLVYSGNTDAITINADNVAVDLNGWTLESTAGAATQAAGIFALGRKNITVRNGTIRGFFRGVFMEDDSGQYHLVEDLKVQRCTFLGIQVKGVGSIVRRNRVESIGGSTAFLLQRIGIDVIGNVSRVLDNDISEIELNKASPSHRAYGIRIINSNNVTVSGNRVLNSIALTPLNSQTSAVLMQGTSTSIVAGNQLSGYSSGVEFNGGLANVYRDNTANVTFEKYSAPNGEAAEGPGNYP